MITATVAICTHDRAELLPGAIEPAIAQCRACRAEILVVDNASTDNTPAVLARMAQDAAPALRVVREPIDPMRLLHECRRREAFGYLGGLARGIPLLPLLRRDMRASAPPREADGTLTCTEPKA